jgi:glycosyltransferase involved in cell wall biosynthesis
LIPPLKHRDYWPFSGGPPGRDEWVEDGTSLPRITVVTPSFNQGEFIERTIRSVLGQEYPNIEYIVMDGGSNDESVRVIEHYNSGISHWESRKDKGQSDAINRGLGMASGEILAWVNSDDWLLPDALWHVARAWLTNSEPHWLSGICKFYDDAGEHCYDWVPNPAAGLGQALSQGAGVPQASSFWSKALWREVGGLDQSLHYCMDEDLLMKFYITGARPIVLEESITVRWVQKDSKTASMLPMFARDFATLVKTHASRVPLDEKARWKSGVANISERWGIRAWKSIARGNLKAAVVYTVSGCRLNASRAVRGVLRGFGAAVKRLVQFQWAT